MLLPFTASIFFENPGRIEEIMMWVLPRYLELMWNLIKKKGIAKHDIPYVRNILFAVTVGAVTHYYIKEENSVKSKYQTAGRMLIGDHKEKEQVKNVGTNSSQKAGASFANTLSGKNEDLKSIRTDEGRVSNDEYTIKSFNTYL